MSTLKDKNGNITYVGDEGVMMESGKTLRQAVKDGDIGGGSDIEIVDNVTSSSANKALSANQGRLLNSYCSRLEDSINTLSPSATLSSYITDNTDTLIPQIREHQTPMSATFAFLTDLHNSALGTYSKTNTVITKIRRMVQAINLVNNYVSIRSVVLGGDYLLNNSSVTKEQADAALNDFNYVIRGLSRELPIASCKGNHDDNSMGTLDDTLNAENFYMNCNKVFENAGVVIDTDNPSGCYGYLDIKTQKIRVIFINSVDIPWIVKDDGTLKYRAQWVKGVQQAQLTFIANALVFDEEGWSVIFVSHHALTSISGYDASTDAYITPANGGASLYGIVKAFKNKGIFSNTVTGDFSSVVSVDYTNNKSNSIICCMNGHTHCDRNAVSDGILFLSTTTATQSNVDTNTDGQTYAPTDNSKDESAMDFITVDKNNSIIYLDRYGFGVSRKFYYAGTDIGNIPD